MLCQGGLESLKANKRVPVRGDSLARVLFCVYLDIMQIMNKIKSFFYLRFGSIMTITAYIIYIIWESSITKPSCTNLKVLYGSRDYECKSLESTQSLVWMTIVSMVFVSLFIFFNKKINKKKEICLS